MSAAMISKMPKKIKVGGFVYSVTKLDRRQARAHNRWGETDTRTLKIEIDEDCPEPRRQEVLLHEVFHCIYDAWNIRSSDDEERTVEAAALGLLTVLKDNPAFVRWLLK